jgi:phosphoribosylformylglycinamidine synthase subunit PurL
VVQLHLGRLRRDALFFGESQSRVILSVRPDEAERVLQTTQQMGVAASRIGTVGGDRCVVTLDDVPSGPGAKIDVDLDSLFDRWAHALERALTSAE